MQRWSARKALPFPNDPRVPIRRADLELIGVEQRVPSFSAHVFFDNSRVGEDSGPKTRGYAASFAFFGHGSDCWGAAGHCAIRDPVSAFDKRAESSAQAANLTVEVTEGLRWLAEREKVRVTILAWSADPETAETEPLRFDELMLITYS